jgi:hypothetical protein
VGQPERDAQEEKKGTKIAFQINGFLLSAHLLSTMKQEDMVQHIQYHNPRPASYSVLSGVFV